MPAGKIPWSNGLRPSWTDWSGLDLVPRAVWPPHTQDGAPGSKMELDPKLMQFRPCILFVQRWLKRYNMGLYDQTKLCQQLISEVTYSLVVADQDVVKPLVEIAISRKTHIVKHWTTTQNCGHGLRDDKIELSYCQHICKMQWKKKLKKILPLEHSTDSGWSGGCGRCNDQGEWTWHWKAQPTGWRGWRDGVSGTVEGREIACGGLQGCGWEKEMV